jgi:hypothetical protein
VHAGGTVPSCVRGCHRSAPCKDIVCWSVLCLIGTPVSPASYISFKVVVSVPSCGRNRVEMDAPQPRPTACLPQTQLLLLRRLRRRPPFISVARLRPSSNRQLQTLHCTAIIVQPFVLDGTRAPCDSWFRAS